MKMRIIGSTYESKEKWQIMKNIWKACDEAGIEQSADIIEYFETGEPEDDFPEVDMENFPASVVINNDGFTVAIADINQHNTHESPEIHFIRFRIEVD